MIGTSKVFNGMLIKAAVLFIKSKFPDMIAKCPIHPFSVNFVNITMDRTFISMMPTGVYRTIVLLKSKNADNILEVASLMEMMWFSQMMRNNCLRIH